MSEEDDLVSAAGTGTGLICPAGGQRIICVDFVNHGLQPNKFKAGKFQRKGTLYWLSEHLIDDPEQPEWHGKPYLLQRRFTLSLDERANLRSFLEAWRGRRFTEEEAAGFHLTKLLGVNAYAQVMHEVKTRGTFAEISSIMALPKEMTKLTVPAWYVRRKDRAPGTPGAIPPAAPGADPDIPF